MRSTWGSTAGRTASSVDRAARFGYVSAQADNQVRKFSLADGKPGLAIRAAPRPDPIALLP